MTAAEMGRKGGKRRTAAQQAAARRNLKRANEKRLNQINQRKELAEKNLDEIKRSRTRSD